MKIKVHTGREVRISHHNDIFMAMNLGYTIISIDGSPVIGLCEECKLPYTNNGRCCDHG